MSQHNGGRLVRQTLHQRSARPSLDRPSLFAGMDGQDGALDADTQRVRILSTLESTRHTIRPAPSKRQRLKLRLGKNWQLKALMGLMLTGVLILLAAFAMIVMNGYSANGKRDDTPDGLQEGATAKPSNARLASTNPLSALIATPADRASSVAANWPDQRAAVIENMVPLPIAEVEPPLRITSRTTPNQISAVISPASAAAAASAVRSIDDRAYAVMTRAKASNTTAKLKTPKDEDVALLEAMFAHTGNRGAPIMSAAEEIKTRCNVLSGAAAATCLARVCVQNPTAAACHQD